MTVEELRTNINRVLALGDMLARFIPGEWDRRILEYGKALATCDPLLQLIVDDVFSDDVGPFGDVEMTVLMGSDPQAIDPATIALIVQLITTFGPVLIEWIRRRRER
jgi:hypothetical protein